MFAQSAALIEVGTAVLISILFALLLARLLMTGLLTLMKVLRNKP